MAKRNQNLMTFVRRKEYARRLKYHETFGHVGGTGYGILQTLWILDFAYLTLFSLGYVLSGISRYFSSQGVADTAAARNAILTVAVAILCMVAALVLLRKCIPNAYLPLAAVAGVLLAIQYGRDVSANRQHFYLLANLAECILLVGLALWLAGITWREQAYFRRVYNEIEERLYRRAVEQTPDGVVDPAQWDAILDAYDPVEMEQIQNQWAGERKPTRSERHRARKQAAGNSSGAAAQDAIQDTVQHAEPDTEQEAET